MALGPNDTSPNIVYIVYKDPEFDAQVLMSKPNPKQYYRS